AVTAGPGLSGALMVGVGAAKGLAAALDRPLYGVNHLAAHVAVDLVAEDVDGLTTPTIALLVSGGHTEILRIGDVVDDIELLGATIDDAAGEAFDKTARLLGLNYPGGPNISKAALGLLDGTGVPGDRTAVKFPRGLAKKQDLRDPERRYNFSFSGLKTAALREVTKAETLGTELRVADIAAGFEDAVVEVLVTKTLLAAADSGTDRVVLGGGGAADPPRRPAPAAPSTGAGVAPPAAPPRPAARLRTMLRSGTRTVPRAALRPMRRTAPRTTPRNGMRARRMMPRAASRTVPRSGTLRPRSRRDCRTVGRLGAPVMGGRTDPTGRSIGASAGPPDSCSSTPSVGCSCSIGRCGRSRAGPGDSPVALEMWV